MRVVWKNIVLFTALLLTMQLAGCIDSREFYEEVNLSRDAAYRQWKNQKEQQRKSQTYISGSLTLQDCLKLTLLNNKTLQRIVQEKEIARGGELESYSAVLPSVGLSGDYLRKDKVASLGTISFGDVDNYSAGLEVIQPIFAGGSIPAKINAARLESLLADQTVRAAVQDVIFDATHGYYDVLLSQHLYRISEDAVRLSRAQLEDVKNKRQGGVASDFDVLRAEVELSNFQAELIKNRNAINIAKAGLLKIMSVSQDSVFTLSDELAYARFEMTMEKAVALAYRNRPDLFERQIDIKLQQQLLKIAKSQYWPSINGFYDNIWSRPDPHNSTEVAWGRAWSAGVSATFPVFDGFSRDGRVLSQKARLKQSKINLIDAEENTLFELASALLSIQDAAEFVESQAMNITRAKEGLRLAEIGYREGINTQLETIDAQAALTTARANYYQAIYSHLVAKLSLQRAMGVLGN